MSVSSKRKRPHRRTMVCVTEQRTCERLICVGAELSGDEALSVVHVVKNGGALLGGGSEGEALDYLYQISRTFGAQMEMLRADDVLGALVDVAKERDVGYVVIGSTNDARSATRVDSALRARLPGVEIIVVP